MDTAADAISVRPLTPDAWPLFEELFGKQGACYGCWCTHFRLPPAMRRENDKQRNKDFIQARIEAGPPPGLLAIEDGKAIGWRRSSRGRRLTLPSGQSHAFSSAPERAAVA